MIRRIFLSLLFLITLQNSPFFPVVPPISHTNTPPAAINIANQDASLSEDEIKERMLSTTKYLKKVNQNFVNCLKKVPSPDINQIAEERCKEALCNALSWNDQVGLDDRQIKLYLIKAQENKADPAALNELIETTASEIIVRLILALDYIQEAYDRTHRETQD
jgi:hypothetical protein